LLLLGAAAAALAAPDAPGAPTTPATGAPAALAFERIEAVRSDWQAASAPATGWQAVTLPDAWAQRWPGFDGVVWYRLRWHESAAPNGALATRAVMIDYANMASAVYLNGSLIGRDRQLVEPLSRAWNQPRWWTVAAPLLRAGENELLLRVSGRAAFQPGLGTVLLASPRVAREAYDDAVFWRRTLQAVGVCITLVMVVVYGMLWLLRRSERVYGLFALHLLLWLPYTYNFVSLHTWPFADSYPYQTTVALSLLASMTTFLLFALAFCQWPARNFQRAVIGLSTLVGSGLLLAPGAYYVALYQAVVLLSLAVFLVACSVVTVHAVRTRAADAIALAVCLNIPVLAAVHGTLVFLGVVPGNRYYVSISASGMLLGISFVLTWRLVKGMRLAEHFNAELQQRVNDATGLVADMLGRQHTAALLQTRLNERLSLVRDLHDGLGMTLTSHINTLRDQTEGKGAIALWALREVNDDLRLIIESSALGDTDELAERLVPLRHRSTRMLEAANIDCRWQLDGLQGARLDGRRALDFLRVLQEALANVLKHSGATEVAVRIALHEGQLLLAVRDNGRGFDSEADARTAEGMGMSSMRARAQRLGGALAWHSDGEGTEFTLRCPLESMATAA